MAGAKNPQAGRTLDEVYYLVLRRGLNKSPRAIAKSQQPVPEKVVAHSAFEPEIISECESVNNYVEGRSQAAIEISSGFRHNFLSLGDYLSLLLPATRDKTDRSGRACGAIQAKRAGLPF